MMIFNFSKFACDSINDLRRLKILFQLQAEITTPHVNFIVYKNSEYFAYTSNSTLATFGTQFSVTISNYSEISSNVRDIDFLYATVCTNKTVSINK